MENFVKSLAFFKTENAEVNDAIKCAEAAIAGDVESFKAFVEWACEEAKSKEEYNNANW